MMTFNRKFSLLDTIRVPLQISPLYAGAYLLCTFISAVIPAVQVLAVANFIDAAVNLQTDSYWRSLFWPLTQLLLLLTVSMLMNPIAKFLNARLEMQMRNVLRVGYIEKINRIQYQHMESPRVWDIINRLTLEAGTYVFYMEEKFSEMFQEMIILVRILVNIGSIVVVLTCQVWWIGILMMAISIPIILLSYKLGNQNYALHRSQRKYYRVSMKLGEMLLFRPYVLERFLFQYAPRLNEKWSQNYRFIRRQTTALNFRRTAIMKLGGILSTLMALLIILLLAYFATTGRVSLGIFLSMVSALFSLSQALSWELADSLYEVAQNQGFFKDLTQFSLLEEIPEKRREQGRDPGAFEWLELRNLRFRYPGTDHYVLNGVSLVMERGKHYAFVGINGAGKTTIAKLLTGFYTDYEGEILINGVNLKEISLSRLLEYYSIVFQDFSRYAISLKENIRLGNPHATDEQIAQAIELVGLKKVVAMLPQGEDTLLGKLKQGGVELSGGEWQRVAMARAVVNNAAIKILDEPTAALDPISESHVYEQFGEISKGATTIFISHRLGSTRLADRIFVLKEGKIIEQGDHIALMAMGGDYSSMFDSQRSWYQ